MKIVVDHVSGSRRGQRQVFASSDRLRFGRHPDNEISFDAHRDLDASSRHAELRQEGGRYVLCDVGSSNGTYLDGQRTTEIPLQKGEPVVVEFGDGGPRVRIWIGEEDDAPSMPALLRPRLGEMVAGALREARARGGVAGVGVFAGSLATRFVRGASWPLKIALLVLIGVLIASVVGLLLWRASLREREVEARRESAREEAWQHREALLRRAGPDIARPGEAGPGIARRASPSLASLIAESAGGDAGSGERFCTAFAVSDQLLATSSRCVDEAEARKRDGGAIRAVLAGGEAVAVGPAHRHISAPVALLEVDRAGPRLDLAPDPASVNVGTLVFLLWNPVPQDRSGDGQDPEISFGPVSAVDSDRRRLRHGLAAPPLAAGAPLLDGAGQVVGVEAAGGNEAVRADALRELMRENSRALEDEDGQPSGEE